MWFRVCFRTDGSVASCKEVETSLPGDGTSVFYVDSASHVLAIHDAKQEYAKSYARLRDAQKKERLRTGRKDRGLCIQCGTRPPLVSRVRCEICIQRKASFALTDTERRVQTPGPVTGAVERTLQTCLDKFESLSPEEFRNWLTARLEREREMRDARLRLVASEDVA